MDEHVGRFLVFLSAEKGASGNTVAAYRNDLQQFATFVGESLNGHSRWDAVPRDLILNYILDLKGRSYAEATVARKVAAIKSFFVFLSSEGIVKKDPTESLDSPRVGKTLPKAISADEMEELLAQPLRRPGPEGVRDSAMLELICATGMRVTELVSLDLDGIQVAGNKSYVRCTGKGSKERTVPISERALVALQLYLEQARPQLVRVATEAALFLNRRGERLTRQGFWLILKNYAKNANIQTDVTPHTLRHSFATHMLRGGASLRDVQEFLGHANISTTQVYTHLAADHVREVYDKAHPRKS